MDRRLAPCFVLVCALIGPSVSAAERGAPPAVGGQVRPSFKITPLVQRFSGRRGQRIQFEFQVQTLDAPQSLRIQAVRLQQELNGLVRADEASPPPDAVQLAGPLELNLRAEETAIIRGHIDVPNEPAPFHSLGILVTDLGRLQTPQPGSPTSLGVRFITQYLLRLEVHVQNGRQESAKKLRIESVNLFEYDGRPFVQADILNPTDTIVEFRLNARILQSSGRTLIPEFGLALPARASRKEPERYNSMVFGQNRVRLIAPVPEAIFPGEYTLELDWISERRKCGGVSVPVVIAEGDFPALASQSVQIGEALSITPAQVELSLRSGGSRRVPLRLANNGPHVLHVRLAALDFDGTPANWALPSPSVFSLPAGADRNVLLIARSGNDIESHRYGLLRVTVDTGGSTSSQDLPIALLGRAEIASNIECGSVHWDSSGERPAFVVRVSNRGSVHIPLDARMTIPDVLGQRVEIPAGFHRWLLPGEECEMRFPFRRPLLPGLYNVQVRIQTGTDQEPLTIDQQVEVPARRPRQDSARPE